MNKWHFILLSRFRQQKCEGVKMIQTGALEALTLEIKRERQTVITLQIVFENEKGKQQRPKTRRKALIVFTWWVRSIIVIIIIVVLSILLRRANYVDIRARINELLSTLLLPEPWQKINSCGILQILYEQSVIIPTFH